MSEQNVEAVRRSFETLAATGEPLWEVIHDDVEVRDHDILDGRDYRGHAGVRQWFEDWGSAWAGYSGEPEEFIDVDDEHLIVVLRVRAKGRRSGVEIDRQDAILYLMRDGKVARLDYFNSKQQALDAAGAGASRPPV